MRLFENILSQTNTIYKENERKRLLFSIKSYILCQTRIIRTEAYRSGHNEAVLKTVWVHAHGGSNPSASARRKKYEPCGSYFFLFTFVRGFERVGRRLVTTVLIFRKNEPTKQPTERLFATPA